MAGESASASESRPKRREASAQAAGMPGTSTAYQPRSGIRPKRSRRKSGSASRGAGPEEMCIRDRYMIEMWSSGGPGDSAEIARVKRWLELQFAAGVSETQRCGNELLSRIG